MKLRTIEIKEGMVLTCETLRWDEGWEFDCPSMMINPVIRCFENGWAHDQIVEDVLIDAVVRKSLKDEDFSETLGWRGYKLPVLKRRFREYMAGKRFPVAGYHANRSTVRIIIDDGELSFVTIPINPNPLEKEGK